MSESTRRAMQMIASWPPRMDLKDVAAWAQRVERLGFDVIHVPETIHDAFTVATLALTHTQRIIVRTSMIVAFPRSPMLTAYAAWDLAKYSDGRFELGIASQVRGNIVGRFSTEWSDPVSRLGDYVNSLRAIFDSFQTGAPLHHSGPHYRFERLQPYFNPGPIAHRAPRIWTGGVNRRMCNLAGELSDGFVCHPTNSHPRVLRASTLPALAQGAAIAQRADGGPAVVTNPQPMMAATHDGVERLREPRRAELAFLYSTPAYRRQLEYFGLEDVGLALSEMAHRADWTDLAGHLTDEVMDLVVPQGSYPEIPDILAEWYSGVCSGISLSVPGDAEDDASLAELVGRCKHIEPAAALAPPEVDESAESRPI
nr:LLM class flavin-dependent oxidoreductase [Mycobacterium marinum]